ncbi:hypothetical protein CEXT_559391 [Caerostris extrusa]|uniref:Uncharacterized protein n=1 Tax=Caerostris extrusa TaxID=172846 RepID=A0AAV4S6I1_CAEEX|nr:hypothetical protein CEXT_559391 [Caerostris extrusa]
MGVENVYFQIKSSRKAVRLDYLYSYTFWNFKKAFMGIMEMSNALPPTQSIELNKVKLTHSKERVHRVDEIWHHPSRCVSPFLEDDTARGMLESATRNGLGFSISISPPSLLAGSSIAGTLFRLIFLLFRLFARLRV